MEIKWEDLQNRLDDDETSEEDEEDSEMFEEENGDDRDTDARKSMRRISLSWTSSMPRSTTRT